MRSLRFSRNRFSSSSPSLAPTSKLSTPVSTSKQHLAFSSPSGTPRSRSVRKATRFNARHQQPKPYRLIPTTQKLRTMASTSTSTSTSSTPFTVSFYATHAQDREGRTLNDILAFSDSDLEYHHDFIQILFPLPERSPINPSAPVINKATREAFLQRSELRREVLRALVRMCRFYGFQASTSDTKEREEGGDKGGKVEVFVRPSTSTQLWTSQSPLWLTRFSHNHLRITRIIRCLRVLGMEALAQGFHRTLLHNDPNGKISARTKMYWERAAKRGLHLAPEEEDDEARGVVWLRGQDGEAERDEDGDGGFDAAKGRMAVLGREEVGEV